MNISTLWQGLILAASVAAAHTALATQHLVAPGQDWSKLASRLQPGDEVILMPGRHVAVAFSNIQGEPGRPIVMRGIDENHPAHIQAGEFGVELTNVRFVTLQDLSIESPTECAIRVSADPEAGDEQRAPRPTGLILRRIRISRVGPDRDASAISLRGLQNVKLEDITITSWGGYGVEIVGCQEVSIARCSMKGHLDYPQRGGIMIRAGTRIVSITDSTFEACGDAGVIAGAASLADEYRPLPTQPRTTRDAKPWEAQQIELERCLFVGCDGAVRIEGVLHFRMQHCTVDHPSIYLLHISGPLNPDRFADTASIMLQGNLFAWKHDHLPRPIFMGRNIAPNGLQLYENLWWSTGPSGPMKVQLPVEPVFPQVLNLDPQLDADHRPANAKAAGFGWKPDSALATVEERGRND